MNQSDSKYMVVAANRGKIYEIVGSLSKGPLRRQQRKRDKTITPAKQDKSDARVWKNVDSFFRDVFTAVVAVVS